MTEPNKLNARLTINGNIEPIVIYSVSPDSELVVGYNKISEILTGKMELLSEDPNLQISTGEIVNAPQEYNF